MKIKLSPEARKELLDAKKYYNKQKKGLGKKFADDVKALMQKIELNPYFASVRYEDIRAPICKKFPFSIHYHLDATRNTILITAVFHTSKNPFWLPDISETEDDE